MCSKLLKVAQSCSKLLKVALSCIDRVVVIWSNSCDTGVRLKISESGFADDDHDVEIVHDCVESP